MFSSCRMVSCLIAFTGEAGLRFGGAYYGDRGSLHRWPSSADHNPSLPSERLELLQIAVENISVRLGEDMIDEAV
jgi:hypothetical protein